MKINALKCSLVLLFLVILLFSCTEEDRGQLAEAHYVDLLYALQHDDQQAARAAVRKLTKDVSTLRAWWYQPVEDEKTENMFFHLSHAEGAFADTRMAIGEGDLELAAIQLDRAVYELSVAAPVAFNELYVGSIYDFVATWLEVSQAVNDQELCSLEWREFSRYGKDARYAWRQVKSRRPSEQVYICTSKEVADFQLAHYLVDDSIDHFIDVVSTGDQCAAQVAAKEVDNSLWTLLLLFRSEPHTDL